MVKPVRGAGSADTSPAPTPIDPGSDPQRVPAAALDQFARLPSTQVNAYLGRIPQASVEALAGAFDARRDRLAAGKNPKPEQRLSFLDREMMASWASTNETRPEAQRIQQVRMGAVSDASGMHTSVDVTTGSGRNRVQTNVPLNLPSGFSATVQRDHSILITRNDRGTIQYPQPSPNIPQNLDHVLLYPDRGKDGGIAFHYVAGNTSSILTPEKLNEYLSRQPARP